LSASAMTRAAMWTANPAICPCWISTSPLCNPARISIPNDRSAEAISEAHARRGTRPSAPGSAGSRLGARSGLALGCSAVPTVRLPEAPIGTSGWTLPATPKVACTDLPSAASVGRRRRWGPKAPRRSPSPTSAPSQLGPGLPRRPSLPFSAPSYRAARTKGPAKDAQRAGGDCGCRDPDSSWQPGSRLTPFMHLLQLRSRSLAVSGQGAITWGTVPKVNPRPLSVLVMQERALASRDWAPTWNRTM
jgi:hypothetical protein